MTIARHARPPRAVGVQVDAGEQQHGHQVGEGAPVLGSGARPRRRCSCRDQDQLHRQRGEQRAAHADEIERQQRDHPGHPAQRLQPQKEREHGRPLAAHVPPGRVTRDGRRRVAPGGSRPGFTVLDTHSTPLAITRLDDNGSRIAKFRRPAGHRESGDPASTQRPRRRAPRARLLDRPPQALAQVDLRLPAQDLARQRDVGLATCGSSVGSASKTISDCEPVTSITASASSSSVNSSGLPMFTGSW